MKLFKSFLVVLSFIALPAMAQDVPVEELPVATIDENYIFTLPEGPIANFYYIDISHIEFADATDAQNHLDNFLTGNLITPTLNYEEKYVVLQVHTEYMGGDLDKEKFIDYLNVRLSKPIK